MWWTFVYKYLFELLLSRCQVQLFATSWAAAYHSFLSFSISQSLLKCMSIELVMSSNHLILCHPLPALNLSQRQSLFQGVSSSHQVAKLLELQLQHQSFQWIFRDDFFQDWLVWSPCYPPLDSLKNLLQHHSSKASIFHHSAFSTVQLTSIHDYWKTHSFDYTDICWQSNVSAFQYAT